MVVELSMCLSLDIEIQSWCPAGPVLSHGEKVKVFLQPWLATLLVTVSQ